jgi:hypothetical protein
MATWATHQTSKYLQNSPVQLTILAVTSPRQNAQRHTSQNAHQTILGPTPLYRSFNSIRIPRWSPQGKKCTEISSALTVNRSQLQVKQCNNRPRNCHEKSGNISCTSKEIRCYYRVYSQVSKLKHLHGQLCGQR